MIWHQYEISALNSRVSFHGETSNGISKCQMFSLSRLSIASHVDSFVVLYHGSNCTPQIWKCAVIAHIFNSWFQQTFIGGMCDKPKESLGFLMQCTWVYFLFLWESPNQNSVVYAMIQIKIPSEKFAFVITFKGIIHLFYWNLQHKIKCSTLQLLAPWKTRVCCFELLSCV